MNIQTNARLPLSEPIDALLADIAIRIQLNATNYGLAVTRYEAINEWIERKGSPLEGLVKLFHPQGSMAIGATIASRLENDEFDIDLIAILDLSPDTPPHEMLSLLEAAIRGEPGSRYYDKTERCTRCIQVRYADGMHLDVTPMVRIETLPEKCGYIFHAPERNKTNFDQRIIANPWGFARWFNAMTPAERQFAVAFSERAKGYESAIYLAEADVEPVPEQSPVYEKSMAVIALQLLKRYRNVRYDQRDGRCPPSVVLAKLVADNANATSTLSEELLYQATRMRDEFATAQNDRRVLDVRNPTCDSDRFTDRWPGTLEAQQVFLDDLQLLVKKIEKLRGDCDLAEMQAVLSELFGEKPTFEAIKEMNRRVGQGIIDGRSRHLPQGGRIVLPTAATVAAVAASANALARATPKHTNFGGIA
jgi:hypothetical protein